MMNAISLLLIQNYNNLTIRAIRKIYMLHQFKSTPGPK